MFYEYHMWSHDSWCHFCKSLKGESLNKRFSDKKNVDAGTVLQFWSFIHLSGASGIIWLARLWSIFQFCFSFLHLVNDISYHKDHLNKNTFELPKLYFGIKPKWKILEKNILKWTKIISMSITVKNSDAVQMKKSGRYKHSIFLKYMY